MRNTLQNAAFVKWACMVVAVIWAIIYHLSQHSAGLSGFVYVNF